MIQNLEANTGKSLAEWIEIVKSSGAEKHGQMIKFLKSEHGFTHGFANLVAHKARQSDAGSSTEDALIADQYKGKEHMKPMYDAMIEKIKAFGSDVELAPKKAYVSLRRKKQFGLIQPSTKSRMDVGINIKGKEPEGALLASGSWNSMVSHRVKLESADQITDDLFQWLKEAYDNAG